MPHLTLEYTANLEDFPASRVLARLNGSLLASGQFEGPDIKSRALALDCFQVGDGMSDAAFVHVTLSLLADRTPETKKALSEALLDAVQHVVSPPGHLQACLQTTVEVRDLDRALYSKR